MVTQGHRRPGRCAGDPHGINELDRHAGHARHHSGETIEGATCTKLAGLGGKGASKGGHAMGRAGRKKESTGKKIGFADRKRYRSDARRRTGPSRLYYEDSRRPDGPPVLLINGQARRMTHVHDGFCAQTGRGADTASSAEPPATRASAKLAGLRAQGSGSTPNRRHLWARPARVPYTLISRDDPGR